MLKSLSSTITKSTFINQQFRKDIVSLKTLSKKNINNKNSMSTSLIEKSKKLAAYQAIDENVNSVSL